ncbi:MAG: ribonuclease HII [Treponema sp.]|nr:ribonuclease HII [Treponema sp.]
MIAVGFDEAGRGPLAGPVCAAAVILPPDFPVELLNDSKKLSEKKRLAAEVVIKEKALWGLSFVDHKTIDKMNILRASLYAMKLAFDDLLAKKDEWIKKNGLGAADYALEKLEGIADGTFVPEVQINCQAVVKADAKYPQVMAASILAKTARDRFMVQMDKKYPGYGYAKHKGYPTAAHKAACRELGPSPIQRLSFSY